MQSGQALLQLRRRELLAGLAAAATLPSAALAASPRSLRAIFDEAAAQASPEARLTVLRSVDDSSLGRAQAAILRMVARGIDRELNLVPDFSFGSPDRGSPYVVSQRHGAWLDLAQPKPGLAARLDEETARLQRDGAHGIAPPDFIIAAVLKGQSAARGLPPDVAAALARQDATLRSLRTAPGAGVWRLPGGRAYYTLRLWCTTGSDLSAATVERRVAAATRALLARVDRLLVRLGLRRHSVGARLRALKARPEHLYPDDESGRARAVEDMNAALDRLRPRLPTWFNPPFEAKAAVRRMSDADERARRRGYREPPFYYPDLASIHDRPDFTLTTVAYHETLPGHVLQLRRQAIADPHPLQIRYAPGYAEGWAIYAESLADRIGLLSPVQQLGYIQSFLFRLARVTADIGLNLHRWSREKAIRYLEETVGFELFFPFDVEVDRYCAEPAGFAGDALAALELLRLAAPAWRAGPAATRAFHDAVLNHGPLAVEALPLVL